MRDGLSNKSDTVSTENIDNQPSDLQLLRLELFCTTKLEADKSILTLSTAGLGLIVTLLTGDNVTSLLELVIFLLSGLSFLVCSFSILRVFNKNADYIQDVNESPALEKELKILDTVISYSFKAGMGLIVLAALLVSSNNLDKNIKERIKNEQQTKTESTIKSNTSGDQLERCDFNNQTATTTATERQEGLIIVTDNKNKQNNHSDEKEKSWVGSILIVKPQQPQNSEPKDNKKE